MNKPSPERVAAAKSAVDKFNKRFPDWELIQHDRDATIANKCVASIEALIQKKFAERAKPLRAEARAMKMTFRSPRARREWLIKKMGFSEEEIFNVSGGEPTDKHMLPLIDGGTDFTLFDNEDDAHDIARRGSGSLIKRALMIQVSETAIVAAVERARRTTKGTRRLQAAERHWAAISEDRDVLDAQEVAASEWKEPPRLGRSVLDGRWKSKPFGKDIIFK